MWAWLCNRSSRKCKNILLFLPWKGRIRVYSRIKYGLISSLCCRQRQVHPGGYRILIQSTQTRERPWVIHIHSAKNAIELKGDEPLPGIELITRIGVEILKFCINDEYILMPTFSVTDWELSMIKIVYPDNADELVIKLQLIDCHNPILERKSHDTKYWRYDHLHSVNPGSW